MQQHVSTLSSESLKHGYFRLDPASSNMQSHSSRAVNEPNENPQANRKSDERKERRRGEKIVVGPSAAVSTSTNVEGPQHGATVSLSPQHSKGSPQQPKSISKISHAESDEVWYI